MCGDGSEPQFKSYKIHTKEHGNENLPFQMILYQELATWARTFPHLVLRTALAREHGLLYPTRHHHHPVVAAVLPARLAV